MWEAPKGGAARAAPSTKKRYPYSEPLFHYFFTTRDNSGRRDLWHESVSQVSVTPAATQMVACFSTFSKAIDEVSWEIRVGLVRAGDEDLLQSSVLGFGLL